MRSFASLIAALALVCVLICACNHHQAQAASLSGAKDLAKSLAEKAADAADKTEAAEETGGVRQTIMHTGANLVLEKGLDALGKRYPVVAAAAPMVQKFSKPAMKKIHEKINAFRNKDETTTTVAPTKGEITPEAPKEEKIEATTTEKPQEVKEQPAGEEKKVKVTTEEKAKADEKKDEAADKKAENEGEKAKEEAKEEVKEEKKEDEKEEKKDEEKEEEEKKEKKEKKADEKKDKKEEKKEQ